MAAHHDMGRIGARLGLALVSAALCAAAARSQQDPDSRAGREALEQRVRTYLQQEATDRKAQETPADTGQARARGQAQRQRSEQARRRLAPLESALEVYREAGWEAAAQSMRRAIRAVELELEAAAARERAPGPDEMVELLGKAAELHQERGHPDRAQVLRELARDWRSGLDPRRPAQERDAQAVGDIDDLGQRIEIVRMARAAHVEAGRQDAADLLGRFLHVAELQRDGASGTAITQALEGIDVRTVLRLLRSASDHYGERGQEKRAAACSALAGFYTARWRGALGIEDRPPERGADGLTPAQREVVLRLERQVEHLTAQIEELKAAVRRLSQDRR